MIPTFIAAQSSEKSLFSERTWLFVMLQKKSIYFGRWVWGVIISKGSYYCYIDSNFELFHVFHGQRIVKFT